MEFADRWIGQSAMPTLGVQVDQADVVSGIPKENQGILSGQMVLAHLEDPDLCSSSFKYLSHRKDHLHHRPFARSCFHLQLSAVGCDDTPDDR
jgi:hypothetical protein